LQEKAQLRREYLLKTKETRQAKCRLRYKNDLNFNVAMRLRGRIGVALRKARAGGLKGGSAVRDLGCSIEQLVCYLQDRFQPGMTWGNAGYYGWHIDHIRPLSSFDLTDRAQFLEAAHYTNLQPLWAWDNLSKGSRWEPPTSDNDNDRCPAVQSSTLPAATAA
jgi:hypothetical protein